MLADYLTLVERFLPDDAARVASLDREGAITAAVERYSKDRPREKVQDVTPTSSQVLPLPAAWVADFSELKTLEYPIGRVPPELIPSDEISLYRNTSAQVIQLATGVAVSANAVRATFTIKHSVTSGEDTIPVGDREPVACYAAAVLCEQLASLYSDEVDSTIQADSARTLSRAERYSKRARELRKRYTDELGVAETKMQAGGTVVQLRRETSDGWPRLRDINKVRA